MSLIKRLKAHYFISGTTDTEDLIDETVARIAQLEAALCEIKAEIVGGGQRARIMAILDKAFALENEPKP